MHEMFVVKSNINWFKLALNLNYRVRKLTEASGGDRCVHNKLDRTVLTTKRLKLDGIVKKSENKKQKQKQKMGEGDLELDGTVRNQTVTIKIGRKVRSLK